MKGIRVAACVAIYATLLVSGCTSGSATITGTLAVDNGACVYVRGPGPSGTDLYWLRHLPPAYKTDEHGLAGPGGRRIRLGESLTVSGTLSWAPFERNCDGTRTLDATAIE